MKVMINDVRKDYRLFEGDYLYLESGIEKNGLLGFHITAQNPADGSEYEIYVYAKNREELEERLIKPLKRLYDEAAKESE